MKEERDFCDSVLEHIPRATPKEREAIRAELEGHLEDRREALMTSGVAEEQAAQEAEAAMGDPAEIGEGFNKLLSPFWLWVKRLAQCGVCLLLAAALMMNGGAGGSLGVRLSGAWDNLLARQGKGLDWGERGPSWEFTQYAWQGGQTMQVGEDLIRLNHVELQPCDSTPEGLYWGLFFFCTYNEDLFTPANSEVLAHITLTSESGVVQPTGPDWGWVGEMGGRSAREGLYRLLVHEEDAYVDVTYNYFGTCVTMRCPLTWQEVEP